MQPDSCMDRHGAQTDRLRNWKGFSQLLLLSPASNHHRTTSPPHSRIIVSLIHPTKRHIKSFTAQFTVHALCHTMLALFRRYQRGLNTTFGLEYQTPPQNRWIKTTTTLSGWYSRAPVAIHQMLICAGCLPKQITVVSVGAWWHGKNKVVQKIKKR